MKFFIGEVTGCPTVPLFLAKSVQCIQYPHQEKLNTTKGILIAMNVGMTWF